MILKDKEFTKERADSINKEASTNENERRSKETQDHIKELNDSSSEISTKVLKKAAEKLAKKFKTLPKSLFQRGLPTPYIRSKDSNPLQFTQDGSHLMYFTKAEFIKVKLPSLEIVKRNKLTRADLSPLFYDYKI